jgi:phage-related protein
MPDDDAWTIEFYIDERGESPVEEFLLGLDVRTRARLVWAFEQVRIRNLNAREPLVKHLDRELWEVRQSSRGNIYRVIYLFFRGRRIVLLHGFQKKTQRTPPREIELAARRRNSFIASEERERRRRDDG